MNVGHEENEDHNLKKSLEMTFICKKCKKAFRKVRKKLGMSVVTVWCTNAIYLGSDWIWRTGFVLSSLW